jgi:hypothetical protein
MGPLGLAPKQVQTHIEYYVHRLVLQMLGYILDESTNKSLCSNYFYNIPRCFIVSTAAPIIDITATAIAAYVTVLDIPPSPVTSEVTVEVWVCV